MQATCAYEPSAALQGARAAKRPVPPAVEVRVDDFIQAEYVERARAATRAVFSYASRVSELREQLVATPHATREFAYVLTLSAECRATVDEVMMMKHAAVSEKGVLSTMCHRRCPKALKLPDNWRELHLRAHDGLLMGLLLRDAIAQEVAAVGHDAVRAWHAKLAIPWCFGCEARALPLSPACSRPLPPAPARSRPLSPALTRFTWLLLAPSGACPFLPTSARSLRRLPASACVRPFPFAPHARSRMLPHATAGGSPSGPAVHSGQDAHLGGRGELRY